MARWIKFDRLSEGWDDVLEKLKHNKRPIKKEWFNLDTGSAVAVITDGDWGESRDGVRAWVRVFHRSPVGVTVELTSAMFPNGETEYDQMAVGHERYTRPLRRVEQRLEEFFVTEDASH